MRNSTIIVKKKKCVNCGKIDYHFSKKMCKQCATIHSTQKRMEEFEEDGESFQYLVSDLDSVFSKYIRTKYADQQGIVKCYTCDKKMTIPESQCGHFISRSNLGTRWMEANCRPQCMECNCFELGNLEEYEHRLDTENSGLVEYLQEIARQVAKPTKDELKSLIIEYRSKLNLAKKKFIKNIL